MKKYFSFFALFVFVATCFYLFYAFYKDTKKNAIDDLISRQMLHAKQAAKGIEEYFDTWFHHLKVISKDDNIIVFNDQGKKILGNVYDKNKDKIKGITRVDVKGRIIFTAPASAAAIGADISYQQHVQEIMKTHNPVVSDMFTAVQGFDAIAVLVPVFKHEKFDGCIGILINFQEIARRYLEDIKIGETGYAWMTSRDGIELYCPVPGHVGNSVFENCKDFPSILAMAREMLQGKQGITSYSFDKIRGDTVKQVTKQAVYMPIRVGNTFWSIVVSASEDEIIASLKGFRNRLIIIIGILLAGGILFSYYGMTAWGIVDEEKKRRKTEQALQESEKRFRGMAANLPGVVYQFYARDNGEMGLYYVSERSKEILGVENTLDDFLERFKACIPPEDKESFIASIQDAVRSRSPWMAEGKFIRPDGKVVYIRGVSQPEQRKHELVFNGVLLDITEHWLAQEALRESEERYRLHFQSASDVIYTIGSDMKVLTLSPSIEHILGFKPEEFIGKPVSAMTDLLTPASWKKAFNDISRVLNGEIISSSEYEFITRDGSILYGEVSGTPIIRDGTVIAVVSIARDVTERKIAEAALRESRQQLLDIIDFLPDATLVIDTDGKVIAWNRAIEEMTGVKAEDMMGKGNYEYALPFYGERRPILIDLVLQPEDEIEKRYIDLERRDLILRGEAYMPALKGGEAYLLGTASVLRDSKGTIVGAIETIHDITERRHAEELYMTMAASAQVGVYIIQEGKIVFVNPHILAYSGFPEEDLIGMRISTFVHPEDRDLVREKAGKMLRGESIPPYEFRIIDSAGNVKWLIETVSMIHYRGKSAVLGNNMDITERKEVERALQESEEKYRLLVEHANEAIFIAQDNVIKFSNPRAQALIGYSADELMEIPFLNHIHPDDKDLVSSMYQKRLNGQTVPLVYSFRIINRTGDILWTDLNAVLVQWEGRPASLNFLRDITLQKNMESQLLRSQKMEAVGTLAGGIAHDFNNLLMGIQGYASLMLLDTEPNVSHYEKLKCIENLVLSGANLTRQLLGFARGGRYEMKPTNLNETIARTSRMFGRTKKEITIFTKYEDDLQSVEVDQGQIEQVLVNLYVNAWQAMPGGGNLYIETQNVFLDEEDTAPHNVEPGGYVKISVTDTGVGMDKKTVERIFEPFFTTKEMGRGTGLGLATVYGIIKGHNGIINVHSEKGQGTTFDIYLPASAKTVSGQRDDQEEILHGKETILIVDDEETIITITKQMLQSLGYRVMTAGSGSEAVDIYKTHGNDIDLVILDMIMPKMSGGEVFDHLKSINPQIRTILSSGYSIDGQAKAILDRGCLTFLQKPFAIRLLSRKIREALDL